MDIIPIKITRAFLADIRFYHNIGEIRSNQSMTTERLIVRNFQHQKLVFNLKRKQPRLFQVQ